MWRLLQHDMPDDFVLATGETHPVHEFVDLAFAEVGTTLQWTGEGVDEKGINAKTNEVLVEVDSRYFRPPEVDLLIGDATKAKNQLGWQATTPFRTLVSDMVKSDMTLVAKEARHRRIDEERMN